MSSCIPHDIMGRLEIRKVDVEIADIPSWAIGTSLALKNEQCKTTLTYVQRFNPVWALELRDNEKSKYRCVM